MSNPPISSTEELNAAIESHNPFTRISVVTTQTVWGKGFPDLPTLNAHAVDKVLQTIREVKTHPSPDQKIASITVTGGIGAGKTQLISRLRRRLINDGMALFIYGNASQYTDTESIRHQFLQDLTRELGRIGSQEVTQWQEVAVSLIKMAQSTASKARPIQIVSKFDSVYRQNLKQCNRNIIKEFSGRILNKRQDIDPYLLRAILWTLSGSYGSYAVEWLAGNELDQETAQEMGLPTKFNTSVEERESEALSKIKQIIRLASEHKPILICFDELDPDKLLSSGLSLPQAMGLLVKTLIDNLEQSERGQGVVILTAMFENIWSHDLKNWTGGSGSVAVVDRMSMATQGQPIALKPINSDSMVELVSLWLKQELYDPRNLVPHDSVYPFEHEKLIEVGRSRPTVREALDWCATNFKIDRQTPEDRYKAAIQEASEIDIEEYWDDDDFIGQILQFSFENLIDQTLEGETATGERLNQLTIREVNENVNIVNSQAEPQNLYNSNRIKFKLLGKENGQDFVLGVSVIQNANAASVGAGLKRLKAYERFGLTRGCLVRARERTINRGTQAFENLKEFTTKLGGEWVYLDPEEFQPLITIYSVYQNCKSYTLTPEQVLEFSQPKLLENSLLREILSDPSGVIDEDTIGAEETSLGIGFDESDKETDDSDDLDNLLNDFMEQFNK